MNKKSQIKTSNYADEKTAKITTALQNHVEPKAIGIGETIWIRVDEYHCNNPENDRTKYSVVATRPKNNVGEHFDSGWACDTYLTDNGQYSSSFYGKYIVTEESYSHRVDRYYNAYTVVQRKFKKDASGDTERGAL